MLFASIPTVTFINGALLLVSGGWLLLKGRTAQDTGRARFWGWVALVAGTALLLLYFR